jgi:hypothetical protein
MLKDRIRNRIENLIREADYVTRHVSAASVDEHQRRLCSAWMTSAEHVVHMLLESPSVPYRRKIDAIISKDFGYQIHLGVHEICAVLQNLLSDMEAGLLGSITDHARAETFDDFLEHAEFYVQQSRKNEAGVISGVVFEDLLRQVCRKQQIVEKDVKLDQLISQLTSNGTFTAVKAKRARVAAHVRTKASHAQWDEFEMDDVRATLAFTHEFIVSHLDS